MEQGRLVAPGGGYRVLVVPAARRMPPDVTATFLSRDQADLADPRRCAAAIDRCLMSEG